MKAQMLLSTTLSGLLLFLSSQAVIAQPTPVAEPSPLKSSSGPAGRDQYQVQVIKEDWNDNSRGRVVPVTIYAPIAPRAQCPVVLFSHGLGGSRDNASYLGRAWAGDGYFCVFMQHAGSDSSLWKGQSSGEGLIKSLTTGQTGSEGIIKSLKTGANGKTAVDRIKDERFVLDHLQSIGGREKIHGCALDLKHIGMSGHSFGALTSLWVAGQKIGLSPFGKGLSFSDPRVSAAVYLSPGKYSSPFPVEKAFGSIKIPGIIFTGSKDTDPIRGSQPEDRAANFNYIQATEQYLVFYDGANHLTFGASPERWSGSELDGKIRNSVAAITCKFWDAYLRDDKSALAWLHGRGLDDFVGASARVQKK